MAEIFKGFSRTNSAPPGATRSVTPRQPGQQGVSCNVHQGGQIEIVETHKVVEKKTSKRSIEKLQSPKRRKEKQQGRKEKPTG